MNRLIGLIVDRGRFHPPLRNLVLETKGGIKKMNPPPQKKKQQPKNKKKKTNKKTTTTKQNKANRQTDR